MIERLPKRRDEIKEISVKFIRGEKSNTYIYSLKEKINRDKFHIIFRNF